MLKINNKRFFWLLLVAALIITWLHLLFIACDLIYTNKKIEDHSEITTETLNDK